MSANVFGILPAYGRLAHGVHYRRDVILSTTPGSVGQSRRISVCRVC